MVKKPKKVVIFFYWRLFSKQNSAAKIKSFNELRKRFVVVAENFMRNFLLLLINTDRVQSKFFLDAKQNKQFFKTTIHFCL